MSMKKSIEDMLKEEGFCITEFSGCSMLPMLREKSDRVLLVKPELPLAVGTVALFRHNGRHVLHRVISREGQSYRFRGDNSIGTEQVAEKDVVGTLSGFWRGDKFFDCTGAYSAAYAKRANRTLLWRKLRAKVRAMLRHGEKENGGN